jgi:hypothetical protein
MDMIKGGKEEDRKGGCDEEEGRKKEGKVGVV